MSEQRSSISADFEEGRVESQGSLSRGAHECHLFLGGLIATLLFQQTIDNRVDNIMFSRKGLTEAESKREESETRTASNRRRSSPDNHERELQTRQRLEN